MQVGHEAAQQRLLLRASTCGLMRRHGLLDVLCAGCEDCRAALRQVLVDDVGSYCWQALCVAAGHLACSQHRSQQEELKTIQGLAYACAVCDQHIQSIWTRQPVERWELVSTTSQAPHPTCIQVLYQLLPVVLQDVDGSQHVACASTGGSGKPYHDSSLGGNCMSTFKMSAHLCQGLLLRCMSA